MINENRNDQTIKQKIVLSHLAIPSKEWAAGVLVAAGTLTFSTSKKELLPAFVAKLGAEKRGLLIAAVAGLGLKNKVYLHKPRKQGSRPEAILTIRDLGQLKNKILPVLHSGLFVGKHTMLQDWLWKIENDERVPNRYKILHKLYQGPIYCNKLKDG